MTHVARRHVFYIPGFDPVPPRAYRERYRREAARQAALSGYDIAPGSPPKGARFGWGVQARIEGADVATGIEVLYWADIVQAGMKGGILFSYLSLLRTAWTYIGSGALFRLMRLRKGPVIAALYPVLVLLIQLAFAMGAGLLVGAGLLAILGSLGLAVPLPVAVLLYTMSILSIGWLILRWFQRRDHLYAWYLMKDYAFSSRYKGAYPREQEKRMRDFADRIATALASDVDEVLVIGHSSGAYIAVSVLADLIRARRLPGDGPALSLLTLGHVVPMVSFLPNATRLRTDLAFLAAQDMPWVDVTAPGDGCAFALCDPVAVSGVAPANKRWPLVISAAFTQTLRPETRAALRWRLFELHFQYLNAFDNLPGRPDDYDYFRITAGPLTLGARFAGRAPSASRIETPVNRHSGIAA
ncbi:hypothetical protein [Roseicyclus marinus]|uniref:hypothetical protein n=1 Tax=Roseicyclus marinus TaxID=2161673 RepID=UPI00240EFDA4|nr:hypothetical protein [Roseicyclus marinus]MDG3040004.1 hypothetical protein [Roseicyclus marinus]